MNQNTSKILIVDDDRESIQLLTEVLSNFGYSADFILEPEFLFQKLEADVPDIILLDVYMPDIDGITLLSQIKSHPFHSEIPVIMLTADDDEKLISNCFELGATDFISKPVKELVLQSRVKTALAAKDYIRQLADLNENLEKRVQERTEALRESEERFRGLVETTNDWVWEVDENTIYTYVSPKIYDLLGYSPGEALGKSPLDLMPPEEAARVAGVFGPIHASQKPFDCLENVNLHKDGRTVVLETSGIPFYDKKGKFIGYRGIDRDITERKKIEDELRKLSQAVEQSPSSVVITDTMGRIEYVNPRFSQITGYSPQEVIGKNPRILKSGETSPEEYKKMWEIIVSGREWQGEFHNKKKNGELYWEFASISSIKNREGKITHFVSVKEDITSKKIIEEKANQQQEQLQQADKMISLGTLVAGVAHEINNPNNAIGLNVSSLEKIWADAKPLLKSGAKMAEEMQLANMPFDEAMKIFQDMLKSIKNGSERIGKIVSGLKDFARVDKSGFEHRIQVEDLLQSSIKLVENLTKDFYCKLRLETSDIPLIKGNFLKLEQVMVNVLINACQAQTDSRGAITISAAHDRPTSRVIIKVRDDGVGMDEDTLNRIMEPFFTTKQNMGGTGLGVSISYGIIREHGGNIVYDSQPAKGTTVTISLPTWNGKED